MIYLAALQGVRRDLLEGGASHWAVFKSVLPAAAADHCRSPVLINSLQVFDVINDQGGPEGAAHHGVPGVCGDVPQFPGPVMAPRWPQIMFLKCTLRDYQVRGDGSRRQRC